MKEKLKTFFLSDWTVSEKSLLLTDILLFGILVGWLTSPLKNGWSVLSNNFRDFRAANGVGDDGEREEEEA